MTGPPPPLQRLPVPTRCFDGEGFTSYSRRLAAANSVTVAEVERALKSAGHTISAGKHAEDRKELWRGLGGLHTSAFTTPTEIDGEEVSERQLCMQCCAGVHARGRRPQLGHICLRHRRWCTDDLQTSIADVPELLDAERMFRRVVAPRHVLVDNHAYLIAQECSTAAVPRDVLKDRAHGRTDLPVEALAYPETVALTRMLTDPRFLGRVLRTPRRDKRLALVEAAVNKLLPYPDALRAVGRVWDVVTVLHERVGTVAPGETEVRDPWNLLRHRRWSEAQT